MIAINTNSQSIQTWFTGHRHSILALMLAVIAGPGAHAQTEEEPGQLEEVIVTAEKRETDLQDTAISIQVYAGEVLLREGKTRIDEIMNGVVGVHSRDSQVGNVFFMRGVDAGGGMGGPTTVSVLIDGVYQSRGETVRGGTLDISQVEVARGTQSTNLGANALAGAISLVTNKPVLGEFEGNTTLGVGNYDLTDLSGVANVPLTENSALRFAYSQSKRDGYLSSNAGNSDLTNTRLKYRIVPTDDFDVTFTLSRNNIGGNGVQQGVLTHAGYWEPYLDSRDPRADPSTVAPPPPPPPPGAPPPPPPPPPPAGNCNPAMQSCYDAYQGYPAFLGHITNDVGFADRDDPWDDGFPANAWANDPFRDTTIDSISADIIWNLSDSITATIIPSIESATFRSAEPPRGSEGGSWMGEDRLQETTQVDARVNGTTERMDWVAGFYYYDTNQTGWFLNVSEPYGMGNNPNVPSTMDNQCGFDMGVEGYCYSYNWTDTGASEATAFYGDITYSVMDALRVQLGLRQSQDDAASQGSVGGPYVYGTSGPQFLAVDGPRGVELQPFTGYTLGDYYTGSWDETTYALGVEYDVADDAMVYATYKTGYQPGMIDGMSGNLTESNTSEQITLGAKSRWLENRLQINVEAFDMAFLNRPISGGLFDTFLSVSPACDPPPFFVQPQPDPYVASDYSCLTPSGANFVIDQQSTGLDVEINWLISDFDRLDVSLEWLDAFYSGLPGKSGNAYTVADVTAAAADVGGNPGDTAAAQALLDAYDARVGSYDGVQLQNASDFSGSLSYSHRFEFPNGATFEPKISADWKTEYWTQGGAPSPGHDVQLALAEGSLVRQDAYTLWNATAAWQSADGDLTITGWIRNIDNKPVMINIGGEPGSSVAFVSLSPPRTLGVTLNMNF